MTKRNHKKHFCKVSKEAVYSALNGWLCDCGHWTNGEDNYHIPIEKGQRFVYEDKFKEDIDEQLLLQSM
jgi:hypothetical protein